MTSNKELQEKRMRGYFIEAASEILKGEGLKAVNVRSVSERAGYSYATLYNYFKDLNELVFICVSGFLNECEAMAAEQSAKHQPGKERIKSSMKSLAGYFVQYPGIFELCFIERINNPVANQSSAKLIYELVDRITQEDFEYLIRNNIISSQTAKTTTLVLKNSMAGLLLHYLNRLQPNDYKTFIANLDEQLTAILA